MSRSKRVILAFACAECESLPAGSDEDGCCTGCGTTLRTVKLVRHDPSADAVVRAAVKPANGRSADEHLSDILRAVERYERRRKR